MTVEFETIYGEEIPKIKIDFPKFWKGSEEIEFKKGGVLPKWLFENAFGFPVESVRISADCFGEPQLSVVIDGDTYRGKLRLNKKEKRLFSFLFDKYIKAC